MEGGGRSENRPYLRKQITRLKSERVNSGTGHTHTVNGRRWRERKAVQEVQSQVKTVPPRRLPILSEMY